MGFGSEGTVFMSTLNYSQLMVILFGNEGTACLVLS